MPGAGVAGTVVAVGEGVDPHRVGRRVVAGTSGAGAYNGGGYAERVAVPAEELFDVPDGLDLSAALAALHDGYMAVSRLSKARCPARRDRCWSPLPEAASAPGWCRSRHAAGARVVAAARGERKLNHARELGADVAVDYSEAGWADRALRGGRRDRDRRGLRWRRRRYRDRAFEATAQGGRFFSYGAASGGFARIDPKEAEQRQIAVVGVQERPDTRGEAARGRAGALRGRRRTGSPDHRRDVSPRARRGRSRRDRGPGRDRKNPAGRLTFAWLVGMPARPVASFGVNPTFGDDHGPCTSDQLASLPLLPRPGRARAQHA